MTDADNKNEERLRLFCKTAAELNAISLIQTEGLLNIAVTAVEALDSKGAASDARRFVEDLRATAEEISRGARTKEEEIYKNVKDAGDGEKEEYFCAAVEEKLIIALENSLADQQQLNVTGDAILAQAAALLLSSAAKPVSN